MDKWIIVVVVIVILCILVIYWKCNAISNATREGFLDNNAGHLYAKSDPHKDLSQLFNPWLPSGCRGAMIYTAGSSEGNALVIKGLVDLWYLSHDQLPVVITSDSEHECTMLVCQQLERLHRAKVVYTTTNIWGEIDPGEVGRAISDNAGNVVICSLIAINNITGTKNDCEALWKLTQSMQVPLHLDITQLAGKVSPWPYANYLTFSGHKFGSQGGIGGLWIMDGAQRPFAQIPGHQNFGMRGGTTDVSAVENMYRSLTKYSWNQKHVNALLDYLYSKIPYILGVVMLSNRNLVINTITIAIPGVKGVDIRDHLKTKGITIGTGSACSKGKPSEMILIKYPNYANNIVRVSVSSQTSYADVKKLVEELNKFINL